MYTDFYDNARLSVVCIEKKHILQYIIWFMYNIFNLAVKVSDP